jgi:hypothetical protein
LPVAWRVLDLRGAMMRRALLASAVTMAALSLVACGGRSGLDAEDPGAADAGTARRADAGGRTGTEMADGGGRTGAQTEDASPPVDNRDSAGPNFPLGVYGKCAVATTGMVIPPPGEGGGGGGGGYSEDDATITLTQTGSVITATDQPASPMSILSGGFALDFVATSDTSAALAPPDQPFVQFSDVLTSCDVTSLTSGSLTYDATSLYLSIVGQVTDDAGITCQIAATYVCGME